MAVLVPVLVVLALGVGLAIRRGGEETARAATAIMLTVAAITVIARSSAALV